MLATLVDPEISRSKLRGEVHLWKANGLHQERGWILMRYDEDQLEVELGFAAPLAIAGATPLPAIVSAIRLKYDNYDLWPPSLTFIDFFSRRPSRPVVRAFQPSPDMGPRDVLIDAHPATLQPFLCLPGIREYHTHPQHTGDDWLLHRDLGEGSISTISERVWQYMVRNIVGLQVLMQALPMMPLRAQVNLAVMQGDIGQIFVPPPVQKPQLVLAEVPEIVGAHPELPNP